MPKIMIDQDEWDRVRSLAEHIIVHGGDARISGEGKYARWNITMGLRPGGGGGSSVGYPAKNKSGTTLAGYVADFYENGFDQAATQSSQPCQVFDLAASDNVPVGEQFMAIPMKATVTGDTE